jgi:hypothetical protein
MSTAHICIIYCLTHSLRWICTCENFDLTSDALIARNSVAQPEAGGRTGGWRTKQLALACTIPIKCIICMCGCSRATLFCMRGREHFIYCCANSTMQRNWSGGVTFLTLHLHPKSRFKIHLVSMMLQAKIGHNIIIALWFYWWKCILVVNRFL